MRVMTFNIQHALDYNKQIIDIDLFVNSIKKYGADFCGINEVRGEGPLDGYTDQANTIGDGLGFNRYFGKAIMVGGTSPYGNAVVTRYPLISCETVMIPDTDDRSEDSNYETRCVIKAVADVDGAKICFLVCHMGLSNAERINAVKTLCGLIDEIKIPLIVMGDFNTVPNDNVLAPLFKRLKDTDEKSENSKISTYPSYNPKIKIDYLLYRGIECIGAKTVTKVISDHFPIVADFKIK